MTSPPPIRLLLGEMSGVTDWMRARWRPVPVPFGAVGAGQPVITIPGFMAHDRAMAQMRRSLDAAGFRAFGWGQGINRGATADLIERLDRRVAQVADQTGQAPALVGWSLGGIYAREYAKHHPARVARVVTMGSPFSGSRRANHAWRLYLAVTGHSVDAPPIDLHPADKPAVPTIALWATRDGVVARDSARGQPAERDVERAVDVTHIGFAFTPPAIAAVIDALTMDVSAAQS